MALKLSAVSYQLKAVFETLSQAVLPLAAIFASFAASGYSGETRSIWLRGSQLSDVSYQFWKLLLPVLR